MSNTKPCLQNNIIKTINKNKQNSKFSFMDQVPEKDKSENEQLVEDTDKRNHNRNLQQFNKKKKRYIAKGAKTATYQVKKSIPMTMMAKHEKNIDCSAKIKRTTLLAKD